MITVEFKGFERFKKRLSDIEKKQLPFATSVALNKTAEWMETDIRLEMRKVLDRPTKFTLKSLYVKRATKRKLQAEVLFKDFIPKGTPADKYLKPQVYGGSRGQKGFEKVLVRYGYLAPGWYAVPGAGARLNRSGNMTAGAITQILTALRALPGTPTVGGREVKFTKRSKAVKKIFAIPYWKQGYHLKPGVYKRMARGVKPLLIFTKNKPKYERRLDFFGIGKKSYKKHFKEEFRKAFRHAMATARR